MFCQIVSELILLLFVCLWQYILTVAQATNWYIDQDGLTIRDLSTMASLELGFKECSTIPCLLFSRKGVFWEVGLVLLFWNKVLYNLPFKRPLKAHCLPSDSLTLTENAHEPKTWEVKSEALGSTRITRESYTLTLHKILAKAETLLQP